MSHLPPFVKEMDVGELTGNGDFDLLDFLDDEEISKHSCPSLSSDPVRLRATAQKQDSAEGLAQILISSGDTDKASRCSSPDPKCLTLVRLKGLRVFKFSSVLLVALLFRLGILLFSVWQDQTRWPDGQLRFTDVDYDVFTDAAQALVSGNNIYEARPTYRYSPLIAAVVAPGYWLFRSQVSHSPKDSFFYPPIQEQTSEPQPSVPIFPDQTLGRLWGKIVFILADLLCAWLQYQIIEMEFENHKYETFVHPVVDSSGVEQNRHRLITWFIVFGWLFNPITAIVSVRGNAEALLGACVLGCLLLLLKRRNFLAGLMFGLCVHLKLYPVIYAPAIYLWLSPPSNLKRSQSVRLWLCELLPSWKHLTFGLATLISLGLLTLFGYVWFGGMRFLWQAYFYHFTRIDIKHNFAPHFYPLYLLTGAKWKADGLANVPKNMFFKPQLASGLLERLRTTLTRYSGSSPSDSYDLINWSILLVMKNIALLSRLFNFTSFAPAAVLVPALSLKLHRHPGLCWFVITYTFVTFNKVCTSQYFLWSLVLLPVALPSLKLPSNLSPRYAVLDSLLLWFGAQAFWLASAYTLEMRTPRSAFMAHFAWLLVWFASLVFLGVNVILIRRFIKWRKPYIDIPEDSLHKTNVLSDEKKTV